MYWNKNIETMSGEEMRALQSERLIDCVNRVYNSVAPYRKKMDAIGLLPGDIKGIDDIEKLPFTTKDDLRDNYPYGMNAVPMSEITEIHASSGTTGKQTVVTYTKSDLEVWNEVAARSLTMAGGTKDDIVHVSYGYGLFTGGLGGHYGGLTIGASTIPVSSGNTKRQIQIMRDFGSTILMCTPSYALYLAEAIEEAGCIDDIHLKAGIFGAEPWTEEMRREIEARLRLKAYDIYGLSEIIGPGVSCECHAQAGMHVQEDHFIPEIINSETGKGLPDGTPGELVFTCVTKQAMPLIRYRTRDISVLTRETCECGRTSVRMLKPQGRADDMLIIRGVNVFPSQIESVLLGISEVSPNYLLIVDRVDNTDRLEVQVELRAEAFAEMDGVRALEGLTKKISREIESTLGISAAVRLVEPKSVKRSEGKAVRVIDNRKLY